jgi:hypothetical protein
MVYAGLLYVDASRKANLGSSCSHSCDSNCTSAVVARNGKLAIALTTVSKHSYPISCTSLSVAM